MAQHTVTINIPLEEAEAISYGLADLLCWLRGFQAASKDADYGPYGISQAISMNIKLKEAIRGYKRELG